MLPSGCVTPARAPGVKSFQSKSGLVSVGSARNLFSGWYQPAFQKRFFSTWSEVKKASIPPEFAVISTVIFCRAWISGSVSHLAFIPDSDSNSEMCFSSTSMNGCLVRSRKSSLPWKRFQLKSCARAGVETNGPAATPVARPCKNVRRVSRRAAIRDLLLPGGDIALRWAPARRHRSALSRSAQERIEAAPALPPDTCYSSCGRGPAPSSEREDNHALPCVRSNGAASVGAGLRLLADGRRPLWSDRGRRGRKGHPPGPRPGCELRGHGTGLRRRTLRGGRGARARKDPARRDSRDQVRRQAAAARSARPAARREPGQHHARGRCEPEAAAYRLHRRAAGALAGREHAVRGNDAGARGGRRLRARPLRRGVELHLRDDR